MGNFMCLLEFECTERLKAHNQAIPKAVATKISDMTVASLGHNENEIIISYFCTMCNRVCQTCHYVGITYKQSTCFIEF